MYSGKLVFAQVMDFLPRHEFDKAVRRYHGNHRVRGFSCRDQFLAMAFAQLTYRESLRDIETCLRSVPSKLYHLGFRGNIARSTLADANRIRDCRIYSDFAQVLIGRARDLYIDQPPDGSEAAAMILSRRNSPQGGVARVFYSVVAGRTQGRSALGWVKTPAFVAALPSVRLAGIVTRPGRHAFDGGKAAGLSRLATRDSKLAC